MKEKKLNIAWTFDNKDNGKILFIISVLSAIEQFKKFNIEKKVNLFFIHYNVPKDTLLKIEETIKKFISDNKYINYFFISYNDFLLKNKNESGSIQRYFDVIKGGKRGNLEYYKIAYARCYLLKMIKKFKLDNIVYVDSDTVFIGNPLKMFELKFENKIQNIGILKVKWTKNVFNEVEWLNNLLNDTTLHANPESFYKEIGFKWDSKNEGLYVNGGVIYYDLRKINIDDFIKKTNHYLNNFDFLFSDQDVIYKYSNGNLLDLTSNIHWNFADHEKQTLKQLIEKEVVLVHFPGSKDRRVIKNKNGKVKYVGFRFKRNNIYYIYSKKYKKYLNNII